MTVYTTDENIKNKLLNNKQVLKTIRELNDVKVYIFIVNDMSLIANKFSKSEQQLIKVVSNRLYL